MPRADKASPHVPQYAGHYGFTSKLTRRGRKAAEAAAQAAATRGFATGFFGGIGIVIFTLSLCTFGQFYHPNVVKLLLAGVAVACAACVALPKGGAALRWMPLGIAGMAALAYGVPIGIHGYDDYGALTYFYAYARMYHNVVPSEKAAAMADAGRIVFSAEARIDQERAVGFAADNGHRYCAAPILGRSASSTENVAEFWAVGLDCCSWQGSFKCDSAAYSNGGGAGVHGGAVIFDEHRIFGISVWDRYERARRKAEAASGMAPAEKPLYVRWITVDEINVLPMKYALKAFFFILMMTCGFALLSVAILWHLAQPPRLPESRPLAPRLDVGDGDASRVDNSNTL